jgi:hypothetical protein
MLKPRRSRMLSPLGVADIYEPASSNRDAAYTPETLYVTEPIENDKNGKYHHPYQRSINRVNHI